MWLRSGEQPDEIQKVAKNIRLYLSFALDLYVGYIKLYQRLISRETNHLSSLSELKHQESTRSLGHRDAKDKLVIVNDSVT